MDSGRRRELENRLQAILGELGSVCRELGLDLGGATPSPSGAEARSGKAGPQTVVTQRLQDAQLPASAPFTSGQILMCRMDELRLAFAAEDVRELARMVEVSPPVDPRPEIEGYINVRGSATPVINLRHMLGIIPELHRPDQFLVFLLSGRTSMAVVVDEVEDIYEMEAEALQSRKQLSLERGLLKGVVRIEEQLVGVIDPVRLAAVSL